MVPLELRDTAVSALVLLFAAEAYVVRCCGVWLGCLRSLCGLRSHAVVCSSCGGFALEMLDTAVSALSFVAVADFELLDTAGLAPLSFVAVVDATVSALSAT